MEVRMNNKIISFVAFAVMIMISAAANAATSYTGYGATEAQAKQSVLNWANGRSVAINCSRPGMGPPWQCTGTVSSTPTGQYYSVTAYSGTQAHATQAAISRWKSKASSSKTPAVSCKRPSYGPPWQCTASGRS